MSKKKILVFIDWFLPGYKAGGPIQSVANLIAHLKDDFDFSVLTRDTDYCETVPYKDIQSNQWNILPDRTRVYYFSKNKLNRRSIKKIIAGEQFDCIYLNGIYSLYFSILPLFILRKKNNVHVIVAARGMLAEGSLAVKRTKKTLFLRLARALGLFDNVVFHATTLSEADDIFKQFGKSAIIKIAPNLPGKYIENRIFSKTKEEGFVKLINIARISPEKNLKFALEALKDVQGNVIFDIYGTIYNTQYWEECLLLIKKMPSNISINYNGSIEKDKVQKLFQEHHFMFMPTTGENFGHVIFEALAAGCPVIISDQTPWKDLEEKQIGWDISLEDTGQFAKIIDYCVGMQQDQYNTMSKNAHEFAHEFVENDKAVDQNKKLFNNTTRT